MSRTEVGAEPRHTSPEVRWTQRAANPCPDPTSAQQRDTKEPWGSPLQGTVAPSHLPHSQQSRRGGGRGRTGPVHTGAAEISLSPVNTRSTLLRRRHGVELEARKRTTVLRSNRGTETPSGGDALVPQVQTGWFAAMNGVTQTADGRGPVSLSQPRGKSRPSSGCLGRKRSHSDRPAHQ